MSPSPKPPSPSQWPELSPEGAADPSSPPLLRSSRREKMQLGICCCYCRGCCCYAWPPRAAFTLPEFAAGAVAAPFLVSFLG
ncbi:uncharacterized protein DS421_4g130510 [Arachis hypogaea]|nr:uncharacterized protein DS421_4g130510 [Arachis hypogaea]